MGNVYFGFRVQGSAPAPLSTTQSGFARIAPDGNGIYVLAGSAAADVAITRDTHNSAPALSRDERIVYVVAKAGTTTSYAYLLGLDTATLETRFKVFLKDPRSNRVNNATVSDDSTASPMVAPDNDVYFGVLANPNNGSRGFLLRFSADLATEKAPGAFGWDSTPAIVPASMVPSYTEELAVSDLYQVQQLPLQRRRRRQSHRPARPGRDADRSARHGQRAGRDARSADGHRADAGWAEHHAGLSAFRP